jgi:hypothetical protein
LPQAEKSLLEDKVEEPFGITINEELQVEDFMVNYPEQLIRRELNQHENFQPLEPKSMQLSEDMHPTAFQKYLAKKKSVKTIQVITQQMKYSLTNY